MTSANWRRRVERKLTDLAAGDASGCVARMSTFISPENFAASVRSAFEQRALRSVPRLYNDRCS
jgi:hypothetical protein